MAVRLSVTLALLLGGSLSAVSAGIVDDIVANRELTFRYM